MLISNITDAIGKTPIIKLNKLSENSYAEIYVKLEFFNPLSSIKDRPAISIVDDAIANGSLAKGGTLIEATSGNMGIALAYICANKGINAIFTMPSSMSAERKALLKMLGAKLVLTDPSLGMSGAIAKSQELFETTPNAFLAKQFENPANPKAHELYTAPEIIADLPDVDIFLAGVGTGGTFSGISKVLKAHNSSVKTIAVEPFESPVISGGKASGHLIQGIGAGFIPANLNTSLIDEVLTVRGEDAITTARQCAFVEALAVGISSGANIAAALELASLKEMKGKKILTVASSCAERYISTRLGTDIL